MLSCVVVMVRAYSSNNYLRHEIKGPAPSICWLSLVGVATLNYRVAIVGEKFFFLFFISRSGTEMLENLFQFGETLISTTKLLKLYFGCPSGLQKCFKHWSLMEVICLTFCLCLCLRVVFCFVLLCVFVSIQMKLK